MKREEIIEILLSVRAPQEGEGDPQIEEAFAEMERDPSLKRIWEQQSQWDSKIKKSIHLISVPEDLKRKILAQNQERQQKSAKIISFPRYLWIPFAAAALLILSFTTFAFRENSKSNDFAQFEGRAVDFTQTVFMLSKSTPQLSEAREWLKSRGTPQSFQIPFHLEGLSQFGCRQVEFFGIRSSMICFEIEGIKKEVHLFVIDKADLQNLPSYGVPEFHEKKGSAVASWTDEKHGYILTGEVTLDQLKMLF